MTVTGAGQLEQVLLDCAERRVSGVLRVTGDPGGSVYLVAGGIAAVETPGAPGPSVVLLRSGRISQADWDAALTAAAAVGGPLGAELVGRGLIGAGSLEAVLRLALADGLLALGSGQTEACALDQLPVTWLLPLAPPAEPAAALAETARRLRVLATLPEPIGPDRDRLSAGPVRSAAGVVLGDGQDEVLALANGRRTVRDMAFVLGRGVFSLTLEVARLREAGLIKVSSRRPLVPDLSRKGAR